MTNKDDYVLVSCLLKSKSNNSKAIKLYRLLVKWLLRLGKRELILVFFVRLFDLCLFGFVGILFLLVSEKGCGL